MACRNFSRINSFKHDDLSVEKNTIGRGGMGVVGLYKWNRTDPARGMVKGQLVAVKRLDIAGSVPDGAILEEASILWGLHEKCNSVLRLYGHLILNNRVNLVLEYMERGNVANFFSKICRYNSFADINKLMPLKFRIAEQVCQGMIFLHRQSILHCDLKAANVLLDCDLNVKICDFGLAKIKQLTTRPSSTPEKSKRGKLNNRPTGTVSHVAPELLYVSGRATFKSDVYSYGILLWELLTGEEPYKGVSCYFVIMKEVSESKRPDLKLLPEGCPEILRTVMENSWRQKANKRPTFTEILQRFTAFSHQKGIDDAVKLANAIWVIHQCGPKEEETVPKNIDDRSSSRRSHIDSRFQIPYDRLDNQQRPVSRRAVSYAGQQRPDLTNDLNDPLMSVEICISQKNNTAEQQRLSESPVDSVDSSLNDHQRLISESSIESIEKHVKIPMKCKVFRILLASLVAVMMAALAFFLTQYLEGHDMLPKGCCLDCFNPSDPYLNNTCAKGNETYYAVPGSDCYLSCSSGYVLNGSVTKLRCNDDGVWAGPLPYCRKIRQCPALNPPANSGSFECTHDFYESSKCTFQCPDGYRLRLPGNGTYVDAFDVTCVEDAVLNFYWTDQEPYCEKVVTCQPPTTDVNVRLSCTPKANEYHNGTECKFACELPMALQNKETVAKCQDDGSWNKTSDIQCVKGCPYFDTPTNCVYNCTNERLYDSRCIFQCDENFTMVGSYNTVCHSGKWTSSPPSCECPSCRSGKKCENSANYIDTWAKFNFTESVKSVNYDGHMISCSNPKPGKIPYECQCRDIVLNKNKQCNDNDSFVNACQMAFSSLLMLQVHNGIYTLPCDANLVPKGC